jgi:molybdopterin molybdotransferase
VSLLTVEEALAAILASATPVDPETVPITACAGRTLAQTVLATRTQPPFSASAMDGYAVRAADIASAPVTLPVIGVSAAGRGFGGTIVPGQTVRIFTGAPVPHGADAIALQEDAVEADGQVTFRTGVPAGRWVRPAGLDFSEGDMLLGAGMRLDPRRLALAAAGGHGVLRVARKPRIGVLATGDELVRPGETPSADQIVASNIYAVAAMAEIAGAEAIDLGIARDTLADLDAALDRAEAANLDVLVTLGGASVGDHDLVQSALAARGMSLGFWRIAMRPGKPLMHGRLGPLLFLGLPGNPVSSLVCALLFLQPLVRALQGDLLAGADKSEPALLGADIAANDARQDYVRATLDRDASGALVATPLPRQDSSMLAAFARADALLLRAPRAAAGKIGDSCRVIRLGIG